MYFCIGAFFARCARMHRVCVALCLETSGLRHT